jgi:hypothetical protein
MKTIINHIGDDLPVKVILEYQPYQPEKKIDGIKSPEIKASVDIKSITTFGYDIDNILTVDAVDRLRERCLKQIMIEEENK